MTWFARSSAVCSLELAEGLVADELDPGAVEHGPQGAVAGHEVVVYDGAPPRQMVTLDLRGRTLVEAVVAALEGQGVNYALAMDASGTHVETLLVSGTASMSASRGASSISSPRSRASRQARTSAAFFRAASGLR